MQTTLPSLKLDFTQNTFEYNYTYLSNYQLHSAVILIYFNFSFQVSFESDP